MKIKILLFKADNDGDEDPFGNADTSEPKNNGGFADFANFDSFEVSKKCFCSYIQGVQDGLGTFLKGYIVTEFHIWGRKIWKIDQIIRGETLQTALMESWYLAWPFTILQNDNITISWDFLRLTAPAAMPGHLGAVSQKKNLMIL